MIAFSRSVTFLMSDILTIISGVTTAGTSIGIPDAPGIPWLRILLVLLLCLAIGIGAIFAIKRYSSRDVPPRLWSKLQGISGSAEIEVIETRRASVHGHVCLFHCRGSAYLIGITAGGATLIDKIPILDQDAQTQ